MYLFKNKKKRRNSKIVAIDTIGETENPRKKIKLPHNKLIAKVRENELVRGARSNSIGGNVGRPFSAGTIKGKTKTYSSLFEEKDFSDEEELLRTPEKMSTKILFNNLSKKLKEDLKNPIPSISSFPNFQLHQSRFKEKESKLDPSKVQESVYIKKEVCEATIKKILIDWNKNRGNYVNALKTMSNKFSLESRRMSKAFLKRYNKMKTEFQINQERKFEEVKQQMIKKYESLLLEKETEVDTFKSDLNSFSNSISMSLREEESDFSELVNGEEDESIESEDETTNTTTSLRSVEKKHQKISQKGKIQEKKSNVEVESDQVAFDSLKLEKEKLKIEKKVIEDYKTKEKEKSKQISRQINTMKLEIAKKATRIQHLNELLTKKENKNEELLKLLEKERKEKLATTVTNKEEVVDNSEMNEADEADEAELNVVETETTEAITEPIEAEKKENDKDQDQENNNDGTDRSEVIDHEKEQLKQEIEEMKAKIKQFEANSRSQEPNDPETKEEQEKINIQRKATKEAKEMAIQTETQMNQPLPTPPNESKEEKEEKEKEKEQKEQKKKELEEKQKEIQEMQRKIEENEAKIKELNLEKSKFLEKLKSKKKKKEKLLKIIEEKETMVTELTKKLNLQIINFENKRLETSTLQNTKIKEIETKYIKEKDDLIASNKEAEKKLKEMEESINELKTKGNEETQKLIDLKSENQKEIETLKQENARIIESMKTESEKTSKFQVQYNKLKDGFTKINERRKELVGSLTKIKVKNQFLQMKLKKTQEEFEKVEESRRKLHNIVEDSKGKMRIFLRCRPLSKKEVEKGFSNVITYPSSSKLKIFDVRRKVFKEFGFSRVFQPSNTQEEVYKDTKDLIQSAIDGYNVGLFAYGQTGSGKTWTISGDCSNEETIGIIPRAIKDIFRISNKRQKMYSYKIESYVLELYLDKLYDLYCSKKEMNLKKDKLQIKKNSKGHVVVTNTIKKQANSSDELFEQYEKALKNRHTRATEMNDSSSRSHLVFTITIKSINKSTKDVTYGKITFVDLAGSERLSKTAITDPEGIKEANAINKSLSALGNVINALSIKKKFIPYRDSLLTLMLSDSLGGNAKTLMFVNVSPADNNSEESINSIVYGQRAKNIVNKVEKARDSKANRRLRTENKFLRKALAEKLDEETYNTVMVALQENRESQKDTPRTPVRRKSEALSLTISNSNGKTIRSFTPKVNRSSSRSPVSVKLKKRSRSRNRSQTLCVPGKQM